MEEITLLRTRFKEQCQEVDDLTYCEEQGFAYQTDMSQSVEYDQEYFDKYVSYQTSDINACLNATRIALMQKYGISSVLDIGVGSGDFLFGVQKKITGIKALGFDINEVAIKMLKDRGIFLDINHDSCSNISAVTFWDSLEHIPNPDEVLSKFDVGTYVFVALPIFPTLQDIKKSKHYRPNEHYYYFTEQGMINYMKEMNFEFIESSDDETKCGRESILSFVFRKLI